MSYPTLRRIWPSALHPTPDEVAVGHTIILHDGDLVTITGVGPARSDGTTLCSGLTDVGHAALIVWQPTEARWTRQPWDGIDSQADH